MLFYTNYIKKFKLFKLSFKYIISLSFLRFKRIILSLRILF